MIRFDTVTGEASYRNGAISGQTILKPTYDAGSECLVAGTTFLADCSTAAPVCDRTFAVILDPRTMEVVRKVQGPEGVDWLANIGPLDAHRWLMLGKDRFFVFDSERVFLSPHETRLTVPDGTLDLSYAGRPGRFLIQIGRDLQLWDASSDTFTPVATLADGFVERWWVHGAEMTFDCGRYAALWANLWDPDNPGNLGGRAK